VPDDWKTANVTHVFKQGNRTLASNCRPVSLPCICCKLLEHVVLLHLNTQLENVIYENQHGFRRRFSCVTQLATINHDIVRHINKGHFVNAVVLYFSKLFYVIDHYILVNKLIKLKINPYVSLWVSSFLTGRSQRVIIDGISSDLAPVTSGVPQGTVLSPTLFVLFINGIVNCVTHSTIRPFANDTLPVTNPNDHHKLQGDFSRLYRWAKKNYMKFNSKKSNVITFGKNTENTENIFTYELGDDPLNRIGVVKYLGILLSAGLK